MTILVPEWLVAIVVALVIFTSLVETVVRIQKWALKRRRVHRLTCAYETLYVVMPTDYCTFGMDMARGRDYTAYTLLGNWTPEDVKALKSYSLKTEASRLLRDMAFPGDADGSYGTTPYSARKYSHEWIDETIAKARAKNDWRAPESALAWGIMCRPDSTPEPGITSRPDNGHGWHVRVARANGHVVMDSTEWWMIMDRKDRWCWDLFLVDVYVPSLRDIMGKIHAQEHEMLFPKTQNRFPRYVMRPRTWTPPSTMPPIMRHLKPTGNPPHPSAYELWRWNVERQEWEVWTDEAPQA